MHRVGGIGGVVEAQEALVLERVVPRAMLFLGRSRWPWFGRSTSVMAVSWQPDAEDPGQDGAPSSTGRLESAASPGDCVLQEEENRCAALLLGRHQRVMLKEDRRVPRTRIMAAGACRAERRRVVVVAGRTLPCR